ncbi:MAG: DNA primase [Thermoanaerobaculales bacterium]|jgi:DNA primase|nr:DNA primase [Thermoanaerobaculales bacterium]
MTDVDLNPQVIAQVREATDLVEVAGDHVKLVKRGRKYEGLCPFHDEKTPSFSIDPEKGLFYCFGCHQGGDAIGFVMQLERLSFPEAVERLARRFGVQLPAASPEARRRRQSSDRLRTILEEAQHWFAGQLETPAGSTARAELERRGFDRPSWPDFGFGYAPDDWRQLLEHLTRRHPEGAVIQAGLAVQPDSGSKPYDRFRHRLTFPVRDGEGRLIAFGGRILGDGEPKYLNSPESELFHKRSTLFCLERARRTIGDRGEAVVVEGYFDCLSLHRVGVTNVVATLGTALTPDHARLLRRRVGADGRVVMCYDADAAGRRAAAAGARVLLEAGVGVAVVGLPPGTDPDDVVRERGAEAMGELLAAPTSLVEFLVRELPEERAARQREAAELAGLVGAARDPHHRDELFIELTQRVGFSQDVLRDLARRVSGRQAAQRPPAGRSSLAAGELLLARIVLDGGSRWRRVVAREVEPSHRGDPRLGRLIEALRRFLVDEVDDRDDTAFVRWLQRSTDDDELLTLVAEVSAATAPELNDDVVRRQLHRVLLEQWRAEARALTAAIRRADDGGDLDRVAELQRELSRLRLRQPEL